MKTSSTQQRERAAQMIAEGRHDYSQIAEALEVDRKTLHAWRKRPDFVERVRELSAEFSEVSKKRGLSRKEYRVNMLADRHSLCRQIIEERAADPKLANIPGGTTGLIVMQARIVGTGKDQKLLPEYVVDVGLLRELRALEEQAAKELGQHVDRHEVLTPNVKDMTDEQLAKLYTQLTGQPPVGFGDSEATGSEEA